MPIVIPAGMIEDRVETDAVHGETQLRGLSHFAGYIGEPRWTRFVLCPGFRDEERTFVAVIDFSEDVVKGTVFGFAHAYR